MKRIVKKAYEYARKKHEGQKRAHSNLPYITHPKFVSEIVAQLTKDEILIAAALLHDVVEDTETTIAEIRQEFGEKIASLVDELTNKAEERGNREKKDYMHWKMRSMSPEAFTIKLADRFHNVLFLERDCKTMEQISFLEWYYKNTVFVLKDIETDREVNAVQKAILNRIRAVLEFLKIRYNFE
jgi:(p)ppGpp synthase/HD superfamily hydrolase